MSLELRDVSYTHPGTDPAAGRLLDGLDLSVGAGEVTGLCAPSGAGKSTLLRIAALMVPADAGTVRINGQEFSRGTPVPREVRRSVGVVLQSPRAAADPRMRLDALVCAPLAFREGAWRPRPRRHSGRLAELAELAQLDPELLHRYPHQVSDGQLQRAMVARALALDPDVLICDEPTAQLDSENTAAVLGMLANRAAAGAAVLIASHDTAALSGVADRMLDLAGINRAGDRAGHA
ncbi:ABC transporter ATP-binding protein [Paeniglutamicibacter psychrophenolicus]|uniref:ABC transporter ATP-binding protein n=1 Tax=Paeniglutamicibacter psychrophenolicus TaxID=257454 RepID=UPI0027845BA8|nr:ATP-binding cassette domain-containing protein [Paeniglutamicibacter psychrophenolicus]MDQ0093817.1 peptide/nickel transport system ATP-binding protein [Paeniglutamicibacter psychrophenolicus]